MQERKTKILIIGSGPAGYSAAIYAARAGFNPILVTGMTPGGQLTITTDVENYPGFAEAIQGPWLMDQMRDQAAHVGAEIVYDYVESVDFSKRPFVCKTSGGTTYIAWCVIIATGAQAMWLGLESEKTFRGFGVSGCATCDGFFFRGKNVAVVGGGNTAVEEALYLTNHASHVTLIHRRDALRAEKILQERLFAHPKISVLWDHVVSEIKGEEAPLRMTGVELTHTKTGEKSLHAFDGLFVAVGHKPATEIFKGQIDMDEVGYITCPPGTVFTNVEGVFAAGDVQERLYRQAVVAAGQGCMAALDAARDIESHPECHF
ncbi:MAG: thioredoxin-disulfide reductase [Proteobacteria bacterium]|nr:thioredoxin-disulfide reductase [Pseudomonadota bacterium]